MVLLPFNYPYINPIMSMRTIQWLFAVVVLISSACSGGQTSENDPQEPAIDSSRLVTVKYSVEGMTCGGCENTVNFALGELPGVTDVSSSFKEMYTLVTYDSGQVNPELIEETITARGYTFKGVFAETAEDSDPDMQQ
jgi:mercuric ion transport protein